jgi:hypothetical protein
MDTMADKDFLADADKSLLEVRPVKGADIQALVNEIYATPATTTQRAAEMLK